MSLRLQFWVLQARLARLFCSPAIVKALTGCNTAQIRQTGPPTEIPRLMCNGLVLVCAIFRKEIHFKSVLWVLVCPLGFAVYCFKFLKSAIMSVALAVSTQAVSESAADLVSTIQHPNFQHIYLITDRDARSFEARLIFQNGELNKPYAEGLAHYIEHLAWLNVTQSENFKALRHSNAWTNLTSTTYVTHSSETWLTKELQRLIEVSAPFTLAERFMLEELDIILREYEANVAKNPYFEIEQNIN